MRVPPEPRGDTLWSSMRFALGMAQMAGTTIAGVLLVRTGVSTLSLLAVVVTCTLTTLSVLLFGSRRDAPRHGRAPDNTLRVGHR